MPLLLTLVLTAASFPPGEGAAAPPTEGGLSGPLAALLQPAPPAPAPAPPTLDQLIQRVQDLRKQKAELQKAEDAAAADLKARLQALKDLLDSLNIDPHPAPPKPPTPPAPPADPLAAKLKAAFDGDAADVAKRREQAKDLAALYRQAAKLAADNSVAAAGDLLSRVKTASAALVGADALKAVRGVVASELAAILPTDDPLTDAQRKSAADLFAKLAVVLETLGSGQ